MSFCNLILLRPVYKDFRKQYSISTYCSWPSINTIETLLSIFLNSLNLCYALLKRLFVILFHKAPSWECVHKYNTCLTSVNCYYDPTETDESDQKVFYCLYCILIVWLIIYIMLNSFCSFEGQLCTFSWVLSLLSRYFYNVYIGKMFGIVFSFSVKQNNIFPCLHYIRPSYNIKKCFSVLSIRMCMST